MKTLYKTLTLCVNLILLNLISGALPVNGVKAQLTVTKDRFLALNNENPRKTTRRKLALLVGISKYEKKDGKDSQWWNLNSKNDLELMSDVLIRRFQFKPENIKIVSDEPVLLNGKTVQPVSPTRKLIKETFRSFLIEQTGAGDIVFFYFAGHGSQIRDVAPDKDELDELDESLVPIDYLTQKDGSNNIRDDEIGELLNELGGKNPANVTIAIDSCFSGTVTRGDYDVVRGGASQPLPEAEIHDDESINNFSAEKVKQSKSLLRNYIFLSAASSRQPAVEASFKEGNGFKKYGVFTYSLAKAMDDAGATTTYRDIYERVLNEVNRARDQQPQIEGNQLDNIFLEEGALPAESYIPVKVNFPNDDKYVVELGAGALQGMTIGSSFELYPPSTKSRGEGKPIALATVSKVSATYSILEVKGNIALDKIKNAARAFEASRNYENVLKVALKDVNSLSGLGEMLKKLGLAVTVPESSPEWNILIRAVSQADRNEKIVPPNFKGVILQRRDRTSIFATIEESVDMAEKVREALINEAKRVVLTSLENTNPDIKVEIRLVPIEVDWEEDSAGRVKKINKVIGDRKEGLQYSKAGNIEFKINDWYRLEVRNKSENEIYVTVLNLDANGKISPVFPRRGGDNLIKGVGKTVNKETGWMPINDSYIRITKPFGLESIHAIATKEKTDFSPLFAPGIIARGTSRGGSFLDELLKEIETIRRNTERGGDEAAQKLETAINSPLGQIFIAAQDGKGVRSAPMPPPFWSAVSVSYMVLNK